MYHHAQHLSLALDKPGVSLLLKTPLVKMNATPSMFTYIIAQKLMLNSF
jgi:hypothetical protein